MDENLIKIVEADLKKESVRIGEFLISYVVAGSGPAVLLLHGLNMGWGQWYPNISEFAKHFKVYAIDFPGSGSSSSIDPHKSDLEKCLVDTVDAFVARKNLRQIHVVAHSLGGWVALKLALKEKPYLDRLVLVSPLGFSEDVPREHRLLGLYSFAKLLAKTTMRPNKKNMRQFVESVFHDVGSLREEFVEYYYNSLKRPIFAHPFLFINRISGLFKVREEFVLLDELSKINLPTLIIAGEKDPIIPFSEKRATAFERIPGARWELFLNTGHVPSIEKSHEFNALVINFLMHS